MGHDHSHHNHIIPSPENLNKVFVWGILLNIIFVVAEGAAGWVIGSMALLSDAGHNLSDVVSLVIAMSAFRLAQFSPNKRYTYGYKKSSILASLVNAIILIVAVVFIIIESIEKLKNPQPIDGTIVAWIAGIGIVINGITAYMFFRHRSHDLNIKGAFMHMFADTLVSVGVLVSGIVINLTGWTLIDPIIGIVIAIIILISTWDLLAQSVRLSLDGVPHNINLSDITAKIRGIDGVNDIHHTHIWAISTTENALTAHIVSSCPVDKLHEIKEDIRHILADNGITHVTLEFECPGEDCMQHEC